MPEEVWKVLLVMLGLMAAVILVGGRLLWAVVAKMWARIEALPLANWYERIESKLDGLDVERIAAHLQQGHEHSQSLQAHELRLSAVEKRNANLDGERHGERIARLEERLHARGGAE